MIKLTLYKRTSIPYILSLATLLTGSSLVTTNAGDLESWWNGKGLLRGNGDTTQRIGQDSNIIFDTRANLEDQGVKFTGKYKGVFFNVVDGHYKNGRSFWGEQADFGVELNPSRILNLDAIDGIKLFANFRYRDSEKKSVDPTEDIGGDTSFQANHMWSGRQFRVTSMGFEYTSKELLPIKDMLIIRAGYLQPNREFLVQPLSKLFLNNMIESAKGVGANIKFSSSYTNWGTTIELKPHKDVYVKNGLFLSSFEQDETRNHGLAFEGYSRDTRRNGLWEMAEIGWTPKFTKDQLEGKYAFGGYYYETRNSWSGGGTQTKSGRREQFQYGFYVQADQMLYREASSDPTKLSKEGLNLFSMASFAPDYTLRSKTGTGQGANKFPFYFQTGLVYTGLLPSRDKDTTEIALGYAKWNNNPGVTSYTDTYVIEAGYTVKINGWWWARPFAQHIHNPAGNNSIQNASVVGLATGLTF